MLNFIFDSLYSQMEDFFIAVNTTVVNTLPVYDGSILIYLKKIAKLWRS